MWPTQFDKRERYICNSGSRFVEIYHPVIDKETGHYELEVDPMQTKDIYEEIQSYKDSCDIHKIVERYRAGDVDVLQRVQGMYGDLTVVPKNIFEFKEMEARLCESFDQLPVDVKQKFDNSYLQFAMSAGSDSWFEKLGFTKQEITGELHKEEGDKAE